MLKKIKDSLTLRALLMSLAVLLAVLLFRESGWLQFLELAAYDLYLGKKTDGTPADPRIALIKITESDIQKLGQWPLSDAVLAAMLGAVFDQGPAVVGLD
ncbi:MAG: CHASE2 domain-containing protein, partial [Proteobacteria bacterium]|nr:CHASE2 domain-containing protein [Pseudomonadota bacterium]